MIRSTTCLLALVSLLAAPSAFAKPAPPALTGTVAGAAFTSRAALYHAKHGLLIVFESEVACADMMKDMPDGSRQLMVAAPWKDAGVVAPRSVKFQHWDDAYLETQFGGAGTVTVDAASRTVTMDVKLDDENAIAGTAPVVVCGA